MGKRILAVLTAFLTFFTVYADEQVVFETAVPMIVTQSEAFRVEFTLNAKPDDKSFVAPSFEGFNVLAGPSVSQGSSMQIINGSMTRSFSYSITYVLQANSAGEHSIGVATIEVDGKSYSTRKTPIEVRAEGDSRVQESSANAEGQQSLEQRAANQLSKDDLLLKVDLSRNSVYKGEAVRATLKLYSRVNVVGSEGAKLPSFDGFWNQQLECEQGPFRQTLNGKVYDAYNLGEFLLYPQQSGTLTIEPAKMTVIVQMFVRNNSRSRHTFFDNTHDIYNLRRELTSPAVSINVKPLPAAAPASFSGAVGRYDMEAQLSSSDIAANSAANIVLQISGSGNIGFLQQPKLVLPTSFELYDIKSTEQIRTTASGSTGFRRFEYPFIARAEGEYTIAPIEFTYFNPDSGKYITLTSQSFALTVQPDKNSNTTSVTTLISKEDVKLLGQDIRFIKLSSPALRTVVAPLVLSPLYFVIMVLIVLIATVVYIVVGKRIRDSHNTALVKGRRANKVAVQRFRMAERYMKEQQRHAFYEEMLRALWGYISDRFNIPVADLTKEGIREELTRRGAAEQAKTFTAIISQCEEAQYSPIESAPMSELYARGIDVVSKIESLVKR